MAITDHTAALELSVNGAFSDEYARIKVVPWYFMALVGNNTVISVTPPDNRSPWLGNAAPRLLLTLLLRMLAA
jgi:hypothetical protein